MLKMPKFNHLHALRRGMRLTMTFVALQYRGGVTRQRIAQIECLREVSAEIEKDFRAALTAALSLRKEGANIILRRIAGKPAPELTGRDATI
jgi:hypothetical protein